jgi:osmotically-inducible protein OsmY
MKADKQLRADVQDELQWDPSVHPELIGVAVEDGIVTLTGAVTSFSERWAAENAAERVAGVKAVSNELQVQIPGDYTRTDTDIARAAVNALTWNVNVPADKVKVEVDDGFVTLKGQVDCQYQKRAAGDAVRNLIGVTGMVNEITVTPSVQAGAIKDQIEKAFRRSGRLDARGILVDVAGNRVFLRGKVHSWAERLQAQDTAWRGRGVHEVENDLQVI